MDSLKDHAPLLYYHRTRDIYFLGLFYPFLFIGRNTVMDIKKSQYFFYAELKSRNPHTTITNMADWFCLSVHGIAM